MKGFAAQEERFVFVLTFICAKQFYVPNTLKQSKTGKNPKINRQSFIIWWHNSRKYRSVWDLLSCTRGRCINIKFLDVFLTWMAIMFQSFLMSVWMSDFIHHLCIIESRETNMLPTKTSSSVLLRSGKLKSGYNFRAEIIYTC